MDFASVVAALASVGVRVSGSTPNSSVQGDSSRACPTGLAGPEPSGTNIDPGQHFQGPALPPLFLGGPAVLGGGVGVAGCNVVVGTGGGGGPGGFLVVLFRGGAWGVGVHADVDPRVCAYGLRLGVGRGFAAAAVVGHALHVGCHRGPVGGRRRCWWTLASFWLGRERSVGLGCGL